jgi:hypothetical protein
MQESCKKKLSEQIFVWEDLSIYVVDLQIFTDADRADAFKGKGAGFSLQRSEYPTSFADSSLVGCMLSMFHSVKSQFSRSVPKLGRTF